MTDIKSITNELLKLFMNKDYNKISIEFDGICDFFCAMVTFKYDDDFRISEFHAS